jgi:hypothetical protein
MKDMRYLDHVSEEFTPIRDLTRNELIERWTIDHNQTPPASISRRLLEYSAAYEKQVKTFGGLTPITQRRLTRFLKDFGKASKETASRSKRDGLSPGTRLVREWHGRSHSVEVMEKGYCYQGRHFGSLSQIAQEITDVHWSGPRFFGL